MPKYNEENERIKRRYFHYLRNAKRCDPATVDKAAEAIQRFEDSTGTKPFKRFHVDQAIRFADYMDAQRNERTGKPLARSTVDATMRAVKAFILWLAGEPGFKSRIRYSDAEYFNTSAKDARIAHARRPSRFPTLQQCRHAFGLMPDGSELERRDKALFAFLMLTGARDGAIASLRLKHIDLVEGCVYQDAREVRTKAAKTFTTWFLPVDTSYTTCFFEWVEYLRSDLLFGHDDALFPKPKVEHGASGFKVTGLSRDTYANAGRIRDVIKFAFVRANLPAFGPHSFRKTLVRWADRQYPSREAFKAFSQNIGHESVVTTVSAYYPVSEERQAELIRG